MQFKSQRQYFWPNISALNYIWICVDIVFLRSWYPVSVPQLYNPVTSLLMPVGQKDTWAGMRTLGQLKHDLGIRNKPNQDSLYKVSPLTEKLSHQWLIIIIIRCCPLHRPLCLWIPTAGCEASSTLQHPPHSQRAAKGPPLQEQTQTDAGQRQNPAGPEETSCRTRAPREKGACCWTCPSLFYICHAFVTPVSFFTVITQRRF